MLGKIFALLLLSASSASAANSFSPYFGVWNGTGVAGNIESNLTATMKPMGKLVTGNFSARPKRGGKSYSGTFRAQPQPDGCYRVLATVMGQPQQVEVTACLQQDKSIAVSSMLVNGTVTPSEDFRKCTFEFNTVIGVKATGELTKKGGARAKKAKRKARKPVEE